MPFSGGVYSKPSTTVTPAVSGTTIASNEFNQWTDDVKDAFNTCFLRDGTATATSDFAMGTNKITGLGNATLIQDAVTADQVIDSNLTYAASSSGNDTYAISLTISPGAYAAGQRFQFIPDTANTGACTLNVNGLGAKSIKMPDGNDPPDNYILADSAVCVIYDGTNMVLENAPAVVVNTTSTQNLTNKSANGKPIYGLVVLDTPEYLTGATADTGAWQQWDMSAGGTESAAAATAGATKAILRVTNNITVTTAGNIAGAIFHCQKNGIGGGTSNNNLRSYTTATKDVGATRDEYGRESIEFVVNLDANSDFEWYFEVAGSTPDSLACSIYLTGYYV